MKRVFVFLSTFLLVLVLEAQTLTVLTEDFPPYNYIEDGKIIGITTEIIEEIFKRTKIDYNIELLPWTRAYKTTLKDKNTVLFSIAYTEERKDLFKWVGPVIPTAMAVIAKKEKNIKIDSISNLASYKIGVVKDDIGEVLLKSAGVPDEAFEEVASPKQNAKKLNAGRVDMVAYEENAMKWVLKNEGFDVDDYEVIYQLQTVNMHIAFNKQTPDSIISKCQKALDEIESDWTIQKYINKYLK